MATASIDMTTGEIVRPSKFDQQLAEATTPAETRAMIARIDLLLQLAHAANQSLEQVNELQIARLKAIRQAGTMLAELEHGNGGRPEKTAEAASGVSAYREAYQEAQITDRTARTWQQVAIIPETVFESYTDECLANDWEVSMNGLLIFAKKPHVANNSGENEWYTPRAFIEAARATMGSIDLDPASSEIANQVVQADTFYTLDDNGLEQEWFGNVWLNPPYAQPEVSYFADKVNAEKENIRQICVLVNNATDTAWFQAVLNIAACVCLVRGRVKFLDTNLKANGAPLQGQAILYVGPNPDRFAENFSQFGAILYADA